MINYYKRLLKLNNLHYLYTGAAKICQKQTGFILMMDILNLGDYIRGFL